jgi:hypothetical protein
MSGGYTQSGLPFSGSSPSSRQRSYEAAEAAAPQRTEKSLAYLRLLGEAGKRGVSDHDASRALGWPLSSVCSIRNGCGELVEPAGTTLGLYGRDVTRWRKR